MSITRDRADADKQYDFSDRVDHPESPYGEGFPGYGILQRVLGYGSLQTSLAYLPAMSLWGPLLQRCRKDRQPLRHQDDAGMQDGAARRLATAFCTPRSREASSWTSFPGCSC